MANGFNMAAFALFACFYRVQWISLYICAETKGGVK